MTIDATLRIVAFLPLAAVVTRQMPALGFAEPKPVLTIEVWIDRAVCKG